MDKTTIIEATTGAALATSAVDNIITKKRIKRIEREIGKLKFDTACNTLSTGCVATGCLLWSIGDHLRCKYEDRKFNEIAQDLRVLDERLSNIENDDNLKKLAEKNAETIKTIQREVSRLREELSTANATQNSINSETRSSINKIRDNLASNTAKMNTMYDINGMNNSIKNMGEDVTRLINEVNGIKAILKPVSNGTK